jgi:hypothetical protein
MSKTVITRTAFVKAPPGVIFELLADPRRHGEIDGSGTIQNARLNAPARLSLGSMFGMDMKMGVPYRIVNTVVEFEENKQIGWRHIGGHIWRYILEPVEGGTQVTEQFDPTTAKSQLILKLSKAETKNAKSIEKTLNNLQELFD